MPTWQNGADIRKAQAAADRKAADKPKTEQAAKADDKPKGR